MSVRPFVSSFGSSLSRAINLHHFGSKFQAFSTLRSLLALLLRLVSVQFPDKIEEEVAQVVPLLFKVDNFIEDEFEEEAVPDEMTMS